MIVHIGVVVLAVAFAASHSFAHRSQVTSAQGQSTSLGGHTVTYLGTETVNHPNRQAIEAELKVDGGQGLPASHQPVRRRRQPVGTPSVKLARRIDDLYLTLVDAPQKPGDPATIGIIVQPLIMWLWIGGGIMALGTAAGGLAGPAAAGRPMPCRPRSPEPSRPVRGPRARPVHP